MREKIDYVRSGGADMSHFLSCNSGKILGGVASAIIFCLAFYGLCTTLATLHYGDLRSAILETSVGQIVAALMFTSLSYAALTGYDVSALRHVGARAPYRTTALASFTSYACSFNLGFPLITGAAVRYWVYSRVNVTAAQIANITMVTSFTFWLGMSVVFGASVVAASVSLSAVDHLPAVVNFLIGATILAAISSYCLWAARGQRIARFAGHALVLPGPLSTLLQTALGALDVLCAAAALYVLLPAGTELDFTAFAAIYIFGCIVGVVSHSPGGIGVFEATMLHAIPAQSQESLLAALLLFRVIYYFLPFMLAVGLLGADEGSRRWSGLRDMVTRTVENRGWL